MLLQSDFHYQDNIGIWRKMAESLGGLIAKKAKEELKERFIGWVFQKASGKEWWKGKPLDRFRRWIDLQKGVVDIQIFSYTGETMFPLISAVLHEKDTPSSHPAKVNIRVLVRDPLHPCLLRNQPKYANYNRDVSDTIHRTIANWRGLAHAIKNIHINVEISCYCFEPYLKCIVINNHYGFLGFYTIDPCHAKKTNKGYLIAPDWVAAATQLVEVSYKRGIEGRIIGWFDNWFETVWENFSNPAP
jgi:hypothetical protein